MLLGYLMLHLSPESPQNLHLFKLHLRLVAMLLPSGDGLAPSTAPCCKSSSKLQNLRGRPCEKRGEAWPQGGTSIAKPSQQVAMLVKALPNLGHQPTQIKP